MGEEKHKKKLSSNTILLNEHNIHIPIEYIFIPEYLFLSEVELFPANSTVTVTGNVLPTVRNSNF